LNQWIHFSQITGSEFPLKQPGEISTSADIYVGSQDRRIVLWKPGEISTSADIFVGSQDWKIVLQKPGEILTSADIFVGLKDRRIVLWKSGEISTSAISINTQREGNKSEWLQGQRLAVEAPVHTNFLKNYTRFNNIKTLLS
jgi:hypothetical protein